MTQTVSRACARFVVVGCFCAIVVFCCACGVEANVVADGSFETPDIAANSFAYETAAAGGAWAFVASAGIIDPPSAFGAPAAVGGSQIGFLQSDFEPSGFGLFSQAISLPSTGTYSLSYFDAGRNYLGYTGDLDYEVLLDATVIVDNVGTTTGQPFTPRQFDFAGNAGPHTLIFRVDPTQELGDNTAFFDQIIIACVPEPSSLVSLSFGALAVAGCGHRWRASWSRHSEG